MSKPAIATGGILALDLTTSCGWAQGVPGETPVAGTLALKRAGDGYGRVGRRFHDWLCDRITETEPLLIAVEKPIGSSRLGDRRIVIGLPQIAATVCDLREIMYLEVAVSTIRAHFCRNGRAGKFGPQAECGARGWEWRTDHEADALALWSYMAEVWWPRIGRGAAGR